MYNTVYIKDCNNTGFSQLIMNEVANSKLKFSNMATTKDKIIYDNMLVYIPKKNLYTLDADALLDNLKAALPHLLGFKKVYIVVNNSEDYNILKSYVEQIGQRKHTFFYIGLSADTLYASIVVEDIVHDSIDLRKSYNRRKRYFK